MDRINIINVYSPNGQLSRDLFCISSSVQGPSFICVDFNSYHPLCGTNISPKHSEDFAHWILNSDFCLFNSPSLIHVTPSCRYSIIDFSFYSSDLLTKTSFQVHEDFFNCDHFPILLTLAIHPPPLEIPRPHFYWKSISLEVNNFLEHCTSITFPGFMYIIRKSMDAHSSCSIFARPSFPPWRSSLLSECFPAEKFFAKESHFSHLT